VLRALACSLSVLALAAPTSAQDADELTPAPAQTQTSVPAQAPTPAPTQTPTPTQAPTPTPPRSRAHARRAHRVLLTSAERSDLVRVRLLPPRERARRTRVPAGEEHEGAGRTEWRCSTPCTLRLDDGAYLAYWSNAGQDQTFDVHDATVLAEAHGGNIPELVIGIGGSAIGALLLGFAVAFGEGACFDVGSDDCPAEHGPLMLGLGSFLLLGGVALMLDSSGFVEVTQMRGVD